MAVLFAGTANRRLQSSYAKSPMKYLNTWRGWLKGLTGSSTRRPYQRPCRATFRPRLEALEHRVLLAAYIVNSVGDEPDGNHGPYNDHIADTGGSPLFDGDGNLIGFTPLTGVVTLRAAIQQANADGAAATITFDAGVTKIVTAGLPAIMVPIVIDGTNAAGKPGVELAGAPGAGNGLTLLGGGSTVKGMAIDSFAGAGIDLESSHNTVTGNRLGTNPAGAAALPNGTGVVVGAGAAFNAIGGVAAADQNLISGNTNVGVMLAGAHDNMVQGNFIGTDISGKLPVPNGIGVVLLFAPSNTIGGASMQADGKLAGPGNVISGNTNDGVRIQGLSALNKIQGNYIGTDCTGGGFLGNGMHGVEINNASANQIGGLLPMPFSDIAGPLSGTGNVISANKHDGILITGAQAMQNKVQGNFIGTDVTGKLAKDPAMNLLGNGDNGVAMNLSAQSNLVGTDSDGVNDRTEGNLISANLKNGVAIADPGTNKNVVAGNLIGTDVTGKLAKDANNVAFGNGFGADGGAAGGAAGGSGVVIFNGAQNNLVGTSGLEAFPFRARNVISANAGDGVAIYGTGTKFNVVAGNLIGIDIGGALGQDANGAALGNGRDGVAVFGGAQKNRIGTNGDGNGDIDEHNVITANIADGIACYGAGTNNNTAAGNYVGLDAFGGVIVAGGATLGNSGWGVAIYGGAQTNIVGTSGTDLNNAAERNVISANFFSGVTIFGTGTNFNRVAGNFIGTDMDATGAADGAGTATGNGTWGVSIGLGAQSNVVGTNGDGADDGAERNIISANTAGGVQIANRDTNRNVVAGNFIGTDVTGTLAIDAANVSFGNGGRGVEISAAAQSNLVGTNGDGVNDSLETNVIANNTSDGVAILGGGTDKNTVAGNDIGTDATETAALPNGANGVTISRGAQANLIGTDGNGLGDAAEGNLISGNSSNGIQITGGGTDGNIVAGNSIGTDGSGAAPLANALFGVLIDRGAQMNTVGTSGADVDTVAETNLISGNGQDGVAIKDPGTDDNTVAGNYIGTDDTGTANLGNGQAFFGTKVPVGAGVVIYNGARSNTVGTNGDGVGDAVEGNLVSGNFADGVEIFGSGTDSNVVAGNYLGTDITGKAVLGNGGSGVEIYGGAQSNRVGTNGDGLSDGAERNIISANSADGVAISDPGTNNNVVAGNYLGTNVRGIVALGNNNDGVAILHGAQNNRIGTDGNGVADQAERNLISANKGNGVTIADAGTNKNVVAGNFIGTGATGMGHLGNGASGVAILHGAESNRIGVSAGDFGYADEGNIIPANTKDGVAIDGNGTNKNVIAGNFIGTDLSGTINLGNGGRGITISGGAQQNRIGTDGDGILDSAERNVIAGNVGDGVAVTGAGTDKNSVAGNYIGVDRTGTVALGNGAGTFGPGTDYAVGSAPSSVVLADLNGDGRRDLITADAGVNNAAVRLGNGAGAFALPVYYHVGRSPQFVEVGDLNGDGIPDLVVVNAGDNTVAVFRGNGKGGFGTPTSYAVGHTPRGVALGDLNGDGKLDLVTANGGDGTISVRLGKGNGTFGPGTSYAVGTAPRFVALADLGGSGHLDAITANFDDTVTVLSGTGTGSFGSAAHYAGGSGPNAVAVADVNGDGLPDLVVADSTGGSVAVLLRQGASFGSPVLYPAGKGPTSVALANVNGDSLPDIVVANAADSTVAVILGTGAGTFGPPTAYPVGARPVSVAVADVNGDGVLDLVTANAGANSVTVRLANSGNGVLIAGGAQHNIIGADGASADIAGQGNVIAANGKNGVAIQDTGTNLNQIAANFIGTDAAGTIKLGNGANGVLISGSGTTVGGLATGLGNTIAFNGLDAMPHRSGVTVAAGTANAILGNAIFGNAALGIDLSADGVTLNNALGHAGPNKFQNFPVPTSAVASATSIKIQATFSSTPNTTFHIEFFTNAAADPSGYGQGQRLAGTTTVTTNGAGLASITVILPLPVAAGEFLSATATDPGGNTSEFSHALLVKGTTTTALTSSLIASLKGQAVTFTATVQADPPGSPMPTGTVTFLDGSTLLATVPLTKGVAKLITASLSVGKHVLSAVYNADKNFVTSSSFRFNLMVARA
jgi:hypothetical protein